MNRILDRKIWSCLIGIPALALSVTAAPVTVAVDAAGQTKSISPYIYGKNHGISQKPGVATHADTIKRYREAGYRMLRLNNGNNATKYHWQNKLSSHPDWYNNVYDVDWDQSAQDVSTGLPGTQSMYALGMIGWAAKSKTANFNDWLYNGSQWWNGVLNDWAGTTPITAAGQAPAGAHNPELYLEKRTHDQTLGIFDHWFGNGATQLDLDSTRFRYWNMDNEADIWNGTHSDVMPDTMSAEEFVQIYVDMALKARAKFPGIKLVGPVLTNEWQWYNWHNNLVPSDGKNISMIEFFIKRIAEEETRTGKRLLDVVDLHFYPEYNAASDKANILQAHRIWFDTSYAYPKAHGIKKAFPGESKTYIFERIRRWLNTYMGADHGVTLGITECGAIDGVKSDASALAVWYASHLGEFGASGDVEVFTPWTMYSGMFETIHMFTSYAKGQALPPLNASNHLLSVYPSKNFAGDSLTLMIVNRNLTDSQQVRIVLDNFNVTGDWAPTFDLANLNGETFVSTTTNALYANAATLLGDTVVLTVPKVSVTAVVLATTSPGTKPVFAPRATSSSSSSSIPSSSSGSSSSTGSSSSANLVVAWNPAMGSQVKTPTGALGGWWYNYKDPLSTISAISAADITAKQALHVVFTGVQDEVQNYNYAGVGFGWLNTAAGQPMATVNLSAYDAICVEYTSNVGIRAGISQPNPTDNTKSKGFLSADAVLPAAATKTMECLPWATFPAGAELDLTKQTQFQLQVGETAEFSIYSISLKPKGTSVAIIPSPVLAPYSQNNKVRLYGLDGTLVREWNNATMETNAQNMDLQGLPPGLYWLRTSVRTSPIYIR